MAPSFELLLYDFLVNIEVIKPLINITLCTVCDGHYDNCFVCAKTLVLW
jgi:hypothetical protein